MQFTIGQTAGENCGNAASVHGMGWGRGKTSAILRPLPPRTSDRHGPLPRKGAGCTGAQPPNRINMETDTGNRSLGLWYGRIVQLTVGGSLVVFAAAYAFGGFDEETTRLCIRLSAKLSVLLFCLAFSASAAHRLLPRGALTFWWKMNRKHLGIAFAIAHLTHLAFLLLLQQCFHPVFELAKPSSLFAGGVAYLFVVLMLLTSFEPFSKHLSPKGWKSLHTVGGWWIWAIFASSYGKRVVEEPAYLPFAALVLAVAVLRLVSMARP